VALGARQVMQARFALEWMTGKIDALPLWNTGTGELHLTDGASACGEAREGPFSGDRVFGRPSLY
jgi:hypothetical protein